jgi:DNA-binding transcriptional LysR family regulator
MNGIRIHHLRAAIAVAEERSITRAALRLRMSQANLTKQIQELEECVGVALFVRNNQGAKPTEVCFVFLEECKLTLLHLERAIHRSRSAAQGAEAILNFGSSPYSDPYLVSTIFSVRLPHYPTLKVIASNAFSDELCHQVMTGQLDVALVASGLPDSRLNHVSVAAHPFYVVISDHDTLTQKRAISLKDCDGRVWILFGRQVNPSLYDQMTGRANELRVEPSEVHHVTSAEQAALLVQDRRAVAFLTHVGAWRIARNGLTMRPLAEEGLILKTALVTRTDDESRLTSQFVRSAMTKLEGRSGFNHRRLPLAG